MKLVCMSTENALLVHNIETDGYKTFGDKFDNHILFAGFHLGNTFHS